MADWARMVENRDAEIERLRGLNDLLRAEFLRLLTEDSETHDRRRKEFNQAIFDAERGYACFNGTDLGMVMEKFDKAARGLR